VADTAAAFAEFAQTSPDVVTRASIFRAVDGVQDPRLLPPLLNGLQDPSPDVRREAAQALTGFGSNPNIRQWLDYVAQSDADSRVRREAFHSLRNLQNPPR
jgi:HEAT repeat protein